MRGVLLCLALFFASPLFANSKSLFINGVYAATYGDISWDKGDWRGNNFSAVRLKAGIQLIRVDFVSLTLGYQKVGFYTGLHKWSGDNSINFDYRGPVLELHLFPDALFGFSFAGSTGTGYSFLKTESQFKYTPCTGCVADAERSELKVGEFSANITAKIAPGLQIVAGAGTRSVKGKPLYGVRNGLDYSFVPGDAQDWKDSETFEQKMEKIHMQKYLALFLVDMQQWFEYRRTGYPKLPKPEDYSVLNGLKNGGEMPARLYYPVYVQSSNPK
ncbi:MAG: SusD/RagB family nutrient-binding outer membrane lipoprotein, partial [Proteobacteria bacterium]